MSRSVPTPLKPAEFPARQASGPSRPEAETPSLKEKATSLVDPSVTVRATKAKNERSDRGVSRRYDRSALPPTVQKKKVRRGEQEAVWKALDLVSSSPFSDEIERARLPERFTAPQLEVYNGRTDPVAHIEQFVRVEEDGGNTSAVLPEVPVRPPNLRSQVRTGQASKASSGPTNYASPSFRAFQTVFKEPIYQILDKIKGQPFFIWPPKLVGDPAARNHNLHCLYHRDKGHLTENCHKYKTHLEQLVANGHLSDYVDSNLIEYKLRETTANRSGTLGSAPAGIIHVIHNPSCTSILPTSFRSDIQKLHTSDGVLESWIMPIFCRHLVREILAPSAHQVFSFSDEDLTDVQMPHSDPLVITFRIEDYDVKRVLVDQDSFVEVMYKGLYEKLGLKEANLDNFSSPLFGFSGESTTPLGKTTLPVLAGPINLQTEFIVIHGFSPYNAIMGRDWLHRMRAVPLTLHQKLRFPTEDGIMETPVTVMGEITAKKDPEKIYFDPSEPEFYFLIRTNLSLVDREELIALLMEFREVFAWSVYEAPGVSLDLACHSLNISSEAKPVSQKRRKLTSERAKIVAKEVDRLLEANAIRPVQYPTWLSNTMIGYHQIPMTLSDQEKTTFINPKGIYCYRVMPFGLKNAGATYQRMVTGMFGHLIGKTVEVYIDDILIKSVRKANHIEDLREVLRVLRSNKLRLNASKCIFGVSSSKFLGHMVSYNGVEANSDQISALLNLEPPKDAKQVQRLTGMIAALGQFISQSVKKCRPFFWLLGKKRKFLWDEDCLAAFQRIKTYLSSPPCLSIPCSGEPLFLYLAISEHAVSAVLVRETHEGQKPVFFVTRWGVHLGSLGVEYKSRTSIKGQVLTDFVTEFQGKGGNSESTNISSPHTEEGSLGWKLFVDRASNMRGAGAGAILVSPEGLILEQAVRLGFLASNNEAEYEALLIGLRSAIRLGADHLQVFCDSQLVVNHISGEYLARDEWMLPYLSIVKSLLSKFDFVQVEQIKRKHNSHADILAKLATALETDLYRTVTVEVLSTLSTLIDTVDRDPTCCAYIRTRWTTFCSRSMKVYAEAILGVDHWLTKQCRRVIGGHICRAMLFDMSGNVINAKDLLRRFTNLLGSLIHYQARGLSLNGAWISFGIPWAVITDNATQFEGKLFKGFCSDLGIKNFFSSPAYPQANGQAEVSNKVILDGIKKRLEEAKGRWVEELPSVMWTHRTTRRRSTGETPFALAYSVEAVIPFEVGLPTTRTTEFDAEENECNLWKYLNLLEERRDMATIRLALYQHQMKRRYDKNIRPRSFQVGDLVLQKVVANTRNPNDGKLGPKWEGSYKVTSFAGVGAYRLMDMDGKSVPRPWNICNLKKYFF
uniref:Uncharacterized protein n=1 Tax=Fagus sylvatica TaxID=28930 RepID=A0A2N9GSW4_FAGSY